MKVNMTIYDNLILINLDSDDKIHIEQCIRELYYV